MGQKIMPCLWFDHNAEDAIDFYTSIFKDSEILEVTRRIDDQPGAEGAPLTITFRIDGQVLMALNGGPEFPFTEAVSLVVDCDSQQEIDELWQQLSAGGEPGPCGWLKDRFGFSWQLVPSVLPAMLRDADTARAKRVMQAVLGMGKLDIATLERAFAGE